MKKFASKDTILQVTNLRIGFEGAHEHAVEDVDLVLTHGRVTALVGESGSGKSVSSRAILGLLPDTATVTGEAQLSGRGDNPDIQLLGAGRKILNQVRGVRIAMVFQEPTTAMNPLMTIGAQIDEIMLVHEDISTSEARQRSLQLLGEVSILDPERIYRSYPHQVSGGQLQRACIAMAIACNPCVLIADEPTTALDMSAQAAILNLLRELVAHRNMGILLITHDMGVVADLADEVIVLRRGRIVESGLVEQVFYHPKEQYTQRLLASVPRLGQVLEAQPAGEGGVSDEDASAAVQALLQPVRSAWAEGEPGVPTVQVTDLTVIYKSFRSSTRAVDKVSFQIDQGEVLALVGESGSGKSTISATLYGQVKPASGQVWVAGKQMSALHGRKRRQLLSGIGLVFQNPASSLNPRRTVVESIAEPLRTHTSLSASERRARAVHAMVAARLDPVYADRYPHELSGGQRQRVAIARAIVLRPSLVIADEPTSALDVSVQAQVLATLQHLQREMGFAFLLITHDLAVVEQLADRVVVLNAGRLVESGPVDQVLSHPAEEYTQRLLDAVPVADPRVQAERRKRLARHSFAI